MKLIVGLGNPGLFLGQSRHNVGFSVVKALKKSYRPALKKEKGIPALSCKIKIGPHNVVLAMPITFMNLSGYAVAGLIKRYKVDFENLLVVCDDLDLEFGRLKLKPSGSSGGHRGLKSIIDTLNCQSFARLRVGIGRPKQGVNASEYVLSGFTRYEKGQLKEILNRAAQCCSSWVTEGLSQAMNIFNAIGD